MSFLKLFSLITFYFLSISSSFAEYNQGTFYFDEGSKKLFLFDEEKGRSEVSYRLSGENLIFEINKRKIVLNYPRICHGEEWRFSVPYGNHYSDYSVIGAGILVEANENNFYQSSICGVGRITGNVNIDRADIRLSSNETNLISAPNDAQITLLQSTLTGDIVIQGDVYIDRRIHNATINGYPGACSQCSNGKGLHVGSMVFDSTIEGVGRIDFCEITAGTYLGLSLGSSYLAYLQIISSTLIGNITTPIFNGQLVLVESLDLEGEIFCGIGAPNGCALRE